MKAKPLKATIATAGVLLVASLGLALPGTASSHGSHHRSHAMKLEGRVLRVNVERGVFVQSVRDRGHKWHTRSGWGRDHRCGNHRVRIRVTGKTRFEDLSGVGDLKRGMKVETIARPVWRKSHTATRHFKKRHHRSLTWVALKVERD